MERGSFTEICYNSFNQFEKFPEALSWYGQAKCFGHAVRLAKENQMDTELMQLALQGSKNLMLSVAKYYDDQQCYDKAASLYYKGGNSGKAIDLCLRNKQYHMIDIITADLSPETTSPDVLKRCSDLYMERGDFAKAMNMLVKGRQVDHALRLCAEKNVQLSEELVEQMVPEGDTSMASELRSQLLMRLGDICQQQGSYHLACKKYTQVGFQQCGLVLLLPNNSTPLATGRGSSKSNDCTTALGRLAKDHLFCWCFRRQEQGNLRDGCKLFADN